MKKTSITIENKVPSTQKEVWLKRIAIGLALIFAYLSSPNGLAVDGVFWILSTDGFYKGLGAFIGIYLIGLTFGFFGSLFTKKEYRTKLTIMHDAYVWMVILCLINFVIRFVL